MTVNNIADNAFDLVLVGGGLQSGLIALAALERRPERRIAIVEQTQALGGNHTWCFHAQDLPAAALGFVEPLVVQRWNGYDVAFPNRRRTLDAPYAAISSQRFAQVVTQAIERAPGCRLVLGKRALRIDAQAVTLDDDSVLRGALVVDARGPDAGAAPTRCGFQKFVGLELDLAQPHGLRRPMLMDATVPQLDGFRFMYVLPFGEKRVLVEDTRFSREARLEPQQLRDEVLRYARQRFAVQEIVREEQGVLPMPWSTERPAPRMPLRAGYRGGLFHPATGYSLPIAVRLACVLAEHQVSEPLWDALGALHRAHDSQARYAEHLNRLLFHAFQPKDMWNVFERFYALPQDVIQRFYALELTATDRARILLGRPPRGISLRAALAIGRPA